MQMHYTVGPASSETELQQLLEVLSPVFHMPVERAPRFRLAVGDANFRIVRTTDCVVGGMAIVHMGQYFGGRSVSMNGIVAVGVAPHFRARGAASALMAETLREMHRDKHCAISTLYPATVPVYRKAGYEIAGGHYETSIDLDRISPRDATLPIRPLVDADMSAVKRLYQTAVQHHNGTLDRGDYLWNRVREPRGEKAAGYVVLEEDHFTGYVFYIVKGNPNEEYLALTDIAATTPTAGRRLLTLLSDHRSMEHHAQWHGGPSPSILLHLREAPARVKLHCYWMLRIVDVPRALAERGYPTCINDELHLDVRDDVIDANTGRFVLRVADGAATVTPGGTGSLSLHVRALSMLYSGHRSVHDLIAVGQAESDQLSIGIADALFRGPEPWMVDMF